MVLLNVFLYSSDSTVGLTPCCNNMTHLISPTLNKDNNNPTHDTNRSVTFAPACIFSLNHNQLCQKSACNFFKTLDNQLTWHNLVEKMSPLFELWRAGLNYHYLIIYFKCIKLKHTKLKWTVIRAKRTKCRHKIQKEEATRSSAALRKHLRQPALSLQYTECFNTCRPFPARRGRIETKGEKKTCSSQSACFKLGLHTCSQVTYLRVDPFEGRVILVHLEVDFSGGDGQSPPGHQDGGNELGRAAQDHWACRVQRRAAVCTISNKEENIKMILVHKIKRGWGPVCTGLGRQAAAWLHQCV